MLHWFQNHEHLIYWIGGLSLVMLLILPLAIAAVLILLPYDYFAEKQRPHHTPQTGMQTALRLLLIALKNVLGLACLLAGFAMLVLPGQGILTMALGISMMNFPGKFRLERWLITRGPTLRWTNRLRLRFQRAPLILIT